MKANIKLTCLSLLLASQFASVSGARAAMDSHERRVLPLWGDELAAKGYDLPEPFGVGVNYTNIRQDVNVNQIGLSGLAIKPGALLVSPALQSALQPALQAIPQPLLQSLMGALPAEMPLPANLYHLQAGKTRMRSYSTTVRFDTWVLPFLNVYALAGKTHGDSTSQVSLDINKPVAAGLLSQVPGLLTQAGIPGAVAQSLGAQAGAALQNAPDHYDFSYTLNFKGATYGAGLTLAGGYKNIFGLLDANFTQTRFNVLDGHINAFTLTPRVGYSFTLPAVAKGASQGKLNVWVGSMYLYTQQTYRGKLSDLRLPFEIQQFLGNNGRFEVKQHVTTPWNVLVGAQYAVTRNFSLTTEVGFARRNSVIVSGEYRF